MSKQRMCKLCGKEPAAVPDRNNAAESARGVKSVCRRCHGERLLGDIRAIRAARRIGTRKPDGAA